MQTAFCGSKVNHGGKHIPTQEMSSSSNYLCPTNMAGSVLLRYLVLCRKASACSGTRGWCLSWCTVQWRRMLLINVKAGTALLGPCFRAASAHTNQSLPPLNSGKLDSSMSNQTVSKSLPSLLKYQSCLQQNISTHAQWPQIIQNRRENQTPAICRCQSPTIQDNQHP